jgi:carboxypeptidase C (cathepsin A)
MNYSKTTSGMAMLVLGVFASSLVIGTPVANAARTADLVTELPGFTLGKGTQLYSGYLNVTGPFEQNDYDSVHIHYILHTSAGTNPEKDPLVTWHQGGPGGNSLYGMFGEMGEFQIGENVTYMNGHAWNKVANMLYLDSPAGSNDPLGYSYCMKDGKRTASCSWNDTSQAEAYAFTLAKFLEAFSEFNGRDLFLSGESYAGQYLPNIAHYILNADSAPAQLLKKQLKGILVGNGCWGGSANKVQCNGPNAEQNDADAYYGKGLISKGQYQAVYDACNYSDSVTRENDSQDAELSLKCAFELEKMSTTVGPHNVYNIYDNCPQAAQLLQAQGKSMRWLKNKLRARFNEGVRGRVSTSVAESNAAFASALGLEQPLDEVGNLGGGYAWACNGIDALGSYLERADVQAALHVSGVFKGQFNYDTSGPASITLYPDIVKQIRVLIYNGDADDCVPYKGNEEWTEGLASDGIIKRTKDWHPWFVTHWPDTSRGTVPAGYATTYSVPGTDLDFHFVTIRLAGHMVPAFQPAAALEFFSRFISGEQL